MQFVTVQGLSKRAEIGVQTEGKDREMLRGSFERGTLRRRRDEYLVQEHSRWASLRRNAVSGHTAERVWSVRLCAAARGQGTRRTVHLRIKALDHQSARLAQVVEPGAVAGKDIILGYANLAERRTARRAEGLDRMREQTLPRKPWCEVESPE